MKHSLVKDIYLLTSLNIDLLHTQNVLKMIRKQHVVFSNLYIFIKGVQPMRITYCEARK